MSAKPLAENRSLINFSSSELNSTANERSDKDENIRKENILLLLRGNKHRSKKRRHIFFILCFFIGIITICTASVLYTKQHQHDQWLIEDVIIIEKPYAIPFTLSYLLLFIFVGISFICPPFMIYFKCYSRTQRASKMMIILNIICITFGIPVFALSILSLTPKSQQMQNTANNDSNIIQYPSWLSIFLLCFSSFIIVLWSIATYNSNNYVSRLQAKYFTQISTENAVEFEDKFSEEINNNHMANYLYSNGLKHPYDRSSLHEMWHMLTQHWLFAVVHLGYHEQLQPYHCYNPPIVDDIVVQYERWEKITEERLARKKKERLKNEMIHRRVQEYEELGVTDNISANSEYDNISFNSSSSSTSISSATSSPKIKFSTFSVLWKLEGRLFLIQFTFFCIAMLSSLAVPSIIVELVSFFESPDIPFSYGVYMCLLLLLAGFVRTLFQSIGVSLTARCLPRVRAILVYAIYQKSVKMATTFDNNGDEDDEENKENKEMSSGQKITLVSADAWMMGKFFAGQPLLFSNLVLVVGAFVLLHLELGYSASSGWVYLIFIVIPLQMMLGRKLKIAGEAYMAESDGRVKFIGELIRGIRITKMYAWELCLLDEVSVRRQREMVQILIRVKYYALIFLFSVTSPACMGLLMFSFYIAAGNELTIGTTFAVINLIQLLRTGTGMIPLLIFLLVGAVVSSKRLDEFFNAQEKTEMLFIEHSNSRRFDDDDGICIHMKDATFVWPRNGNGNGDHDESKVGEGKEEKEEKEEMHEFKLDSICLDLKKHKLYAIIGSVGSGKSSLAQAILQEMKMISGEFHISFNEKINKDECIAYVPQTAFIMNATVRENILFGLDFEPRYYQICLVAAALIHDLSVLPNGDLTEIGERGINVSGGQKQRISFARALYRRHLTDIFLFDDPLSAVDMHVGNTMFTKGIKEILKSKTVIIVMNSHLHLLPMMDEVLILDNGKLVCQKTYADIMENNIYSHLFLDANKNTNGKNIDNDEEKDIQSVLKYETNDEKKDEIQSKMASKVIADTMDDHGKLVMKEDQERGAVAWNVYVRFFQNAVKIFNYKLIESKEYYDRRMQLQQENSNANVDSHSYKSILIFSSLGILMLITQTTATMTDIWLSFWGEESDVNRFPQYEDTFWLSIWGVMIVFYGAFVFISFYYFGYLNCRAAESLHMKALYCVLRAPMSYFDCTPTGRILNRFSKDTNEMDIDLSRFFLNWIGTQMQVLAFIAVIVITMPVMIVLFIIFLPVAYYMQSYFRYSSSDLKRLEQVTISPVISQFSETLQGLHTIRAYKMSNKIVLHSIRKKIRLNHRVYHTEQGTYAWFQMNMNLLVTFLSFLIALFACLCKGTMANSMLALAVTYGYSMMSFAQFSILLSVGLEKNFCAVERLLYFEHALDKHGSGAEYKEDDNDDENEEEILERQKQITCEADPINWSYRPPGIEDNIDERQMNKWPFMGKISFRNLKMKYRKDLRLVLSGINADINAGEKIGIVGRTGAGKSSLFLALFRLVEPEAESEIEIDGIDCLRLGLRDLRSSLAIIPQEAVLFSGTVRFNLDPFYEYSDEEIWDILVKCELYDFIRSKPEKLLFMVAEDGNNFSNGQKQLLCIGRALLKKCRILVLDEATSAIDKYTDSLIQKLIRHDFENVTVLCIAHRLETILDYDRILVLEDGKVVEFDSPEVLLQNENGIFYHMINSGVEQENI